jgi:hypothetical protein
MQSKNAKRFGGFDTTLDGVGQSTVFTGRG